MCIPFKFTLKDLLNKLGILALVSVVILTSCRSTFSGDRKRNDLNDAPHRTSLKEIYENNTTGAATSNVYQSNLDNELRTPPPSEAKVFYFDDTKGLNLSDGFDEAALIPVLAGVVGAAIIGGAAAAAGIKKRFKSVSDVDMQRILFMQMSHLNNVDYVAIKAHRIGKPIPFSGHDMSAKLPVYRGVQRLASLGKLKEGEVSYVIFKDQEAAGKSFVQADTRLIKYDITSQFKDLNLPQGAVVYKVEKISKQFEQRTFFTEQLHYANVDFADIGVSKQLANGQMYTITRKIKSGVSGDVYEVQINDGITSHSMALKVIKNKFEYPSVIANEVNNMIRFNRNVNFIDYYGSFKDRQGRVVLAQELGGMDLEEAYIKSIPVGRPTFKQVFSDAVDGIKVIHSRNMLHGDIKPQNMLLSQSGRIKIIDTADALTITPGKKRPQLFGSPNYSAPEIYTKSYDVNIDWRQSDIYSLGMSMLEIRFGKSINDIAEEIGVPLDRWGVADPLKNGDFVKNLKESKTYNIGAKDTDLIIEMIDPNWANRPSIDTVKHRLNDIP